MHIANIVGDHNDNSNENDNVGAVVGGVIGGVMIAVLLLSMCTCGVLIYCRKKSVETVCFGKCQTDSIICKLWLDIWNPPPIATHIQFYNFKHP